jgi:hypothetical protein
VPTLTLSLPTPTHPRLLALLVILKVDLMSDTPSQCDHTFKITFAPAKFEAVVAKSCKAAHTIDLIAHDPTLVPQVRIFNVAFTSPEDRDRVRIAMRFLEKEMIEMEKARQQVQAPAAIPTLARRLASA